MSKTYQCPEKDMSNLAKNQTNKQTNKQTTTTTTTTTTKNKETKKERRKERGEAQWSSKCKCKFNVKHRECLRKHPSQSLKVKCLRIIQIELEFGNVGF